MMFWTLRDSPTGSVTLCEDCALLATNMGAGAVIEEEFTSMQEAALILSALLSTIGGDFPVSSSTTGACGNCPKRFEGVSA